MSSNIDTCEDYACEHGDNHTHVGVHPHLRRVIDITGKLVDGKTGEPPAEGASESGPTA